MERHNELDVVGEIEREGAFLTKLEVAASQPYLSREMVRPT